MMQVDSESTQASQAPDGGNVLFEPEIYRPQIDEAMEDDARSVSTHAGVNASMVSNYKTGLDPSLFSANRM